MRGAVLFGDARAVRDVSLAGRARIVRALREDQARAARDPRLRAHRAPELGDYGRVDLRMKERGGLRAWRRAPSPG